MSQPTPFSTTPVTYAGQALPRVRAIDDSIWTTYLGLPGSMVELSPVSAVTNPTITRSRSESVHTFLNGGVGIQRTIGSKRTYTLNWDMLRGRDWQLIQAFYAGVYGAGPFCLVTADDRNRLSQSASLTGGLNGDASKWGVTSPSTIALDFASTAPPVQPAGVLRWIGAGNGYVATVGGVVSGGLFPDAGSVSSAGSAVPYIPAQPVAISVYAKAASTSVSLTLSAAGRNADSTDVADVTGSPVTVTSSGWTRLTLLVAANALGTSAYVMPVIKCNTSSAGAILLSCAQVEYDTAVTDWSMGSHVARVHLTSDLSAALDGVLGKSVQLTFAEAP